MSGELLTQAYPGLAPLRRGHCSTNRRAGRGVCTQRVRGSSLFSRDLHHRRVLAEAEAGPDTPQVSTLRRPRAPRLGPRPRPRPKGCSGRGASPPPGMKFRSPPCPRPLARLQSPPGRPRLVSPCPGWVDASCWLWSGKSASSLQPPARGLFLRRLRGRGRGSQARGVLGQPGPPAVSEGLPPRASSGYVPGGPAWAAGTLRAGFLPPAVLCRSSGLSWDAMREGLLGFRRWEYAF